ncbi:MAG: hypothetical protein AAFP97_13395, partial [Pseudomonadota bacterium]
MDYFKTPLSSIAVPVLSALILSACSSGTESGSDDNVVSTLPQSIAPQTLFETGDAGDSALAGAFAVSWETRLAAATVPEAPVSDCAQFDPDKVDDLLPRAGQALETSFTLFSERPQPCEDDACLNIAPTRDALVQLLEVSGALADEVVAYDILALSLYPDRALSVLNSEYQSTLELFLAAHARTNRDALPASLDRLTAINLLVTDAQMQERQRASQGIPYASYIADRLKTAEFRIEQIVELGATYNEASPQDVTVAIAEAEYADQLMDHIAESMAALNAANHAVESSLRAASVCQTSQARAIVE